MTHRMASDRLDLPEPLGPTMAVMASPKDKTVLSGKDLNPWISSAFKYKPDTSLRFLHSGNKSVVISNYTKRAGFLQTLLPRPFHLFPAGSSVIISV